MDEQKLSKNEVEKTVDAEASQKTEEASKKAKTDVFICIIGIALGIFAAVEGRKMPSDTLVNAKWYTAPAFLPTIFGIALAILCLIQLVIDIRMSNGISKEDAAKAIGYFKSREFFRLVLAVILLTTYIFGLLGHLPFWLATFLYLICTMMCFATKRDMKQIAIMIIVSVIAAAAVSYGFGTLAQIPLP